MRRCYLSKNYPEIKSAGNKAKTDIESIMLSNGFINIGLPQTIYRNKALGYFRTLGSVIKAIFCLHKDDLLVLQYPFKKYYKFVCRLAHWKKARTITLIHDFGAFRRKKLTIAQEKKRLSHTDYIIALNEIMKTWLIDHDYAQPIGVTGLWDYLSTSEPLEKEARQTFKEIIHAGPLNPQKHGFIYKLDKNMTNESCHFTIYGSDFRPDMITHPHNFTYKGFAYPDELIATQTGDFGLVWYGNSTNIVDGIFGEYMQITSPHKPSLYLRCHLPLILWERMALAPFVKENKVGLVISSLDELDEIVESVTPEHYLEMKENVKRISKLIAAGHYFITAYNEAEKTLLKNNENTN